MTAIHDKQIITSQERFNLSDEAVQSFDKMGIDWKGRDIQEVYDEFRLKTMVKAAVVFQKKLQENSLRREESNVALVDLMQKIFDPQGIPPFPKPNPQLHRFDPVSGTYLELHGTDCRRWKKIDQRNFAIAKRLDEILQSKGYKTLILEMDK